MAGPDDNAPNLNLYNPNVSSALEPVETYVIGREHLDTLISEISDIAYPYVGLFAEQIPVASNGLLDAIRKKRQTEFTTEKHSGEYKTDYKFTLDYLRESQASHLKKVTMLADSTAGTPFNLSMSIHHGALSTLGLMWDYEDPKTPALYRLANPALAAFLQETFRNSWSWYDASLEFNIGNTFGMQVASRVGLAKYTYNPQTDLFTKILLKPEVFESAAQEITHPTFLQLLSDSLALIPTQ
jgi:hypothetical protein